MRIRLIVIMMMLSIDSLADERMIGLKHTFNKERCVVSTFFNDSLRISVEDKRIFQHGERKGCETHLNYEVFSRDIKFCALAKSPSFGDCKLSIEGRGMNKTVEFSNYVHGDFNECLYTCLAK